MIVCETLGCEILKLFEALKSVVVDPSKDSDFRKNLFLDSV